MCLAIFFMFKQLYEVGPWCLIMVNFASLQSSCVQTFPFPNNKPWKYIYTRFSVLQNKKFEGDRGVIFSSRIVANRTTCVPKTSLLLDTKKNLVCLFWVLDLFYKYEEQDLLRYKIYNNVTYLLFCTETEMPLSPCIVKCLSLTVSVISYRDQLVLFYFTRLPAFAQVHISYEGEMTPLVNVVFFQKMWIYGIEFYMKCSFHRPFYICQSVTAAKMLMIFKLSVRPCCIETQTVKGWSTDHGF